MVRKRLKKSENRNSLQNTLKERTRTTLLTTLVLFFSHFISIMDFNRVYTNILTFSHGHTQHSIQDIFFAFGAQVLYRRSGFSRNR